MLSVYLQAANNPHSSSRIAYAQLAFTNATFRYSAQNLTSDTDYILILTANNRNLRAHQTCKLTVTTLATARNYIRNPGIEEAAPAPHVATRHLELPNSARHWTSFYNGGAIRACGIIHVSNRTLLHPRSGRCCLQLGFMADQLVSQVQKFFGAYQSVRMDVAPGARFIFSAWYAVSEDLAASYRQDDAESARDALSIIIGFRHEDGTLDDGVIVPLDAEAKGWRLVCATMVAPESGVDMVHVFLHRHDYTAGSLFIDDVALFKVRIDDDVQRVSDVCYRDNGKTMQVQRKVAVDVQLRAEVVAKSKQLTLAVPLTADRVLRLEAMSRLYGGGPICAAVLVKSRQEAEYFTGIWYRKLWLRRHVSVSFFRKAEGEIALNALRNRAVACAESEFVVMLDVDMTPDSEKFACMRDENGSYLEGYLGAGSRRVLALPVFITDVQRRAAVGKGELMNQMNQRVGTWYCLVSQKAYRPTRWYEYSQGVETKVMEGYEPYGMMRREQYVAFDERFEGYGLNKISWAVSVESVGMKIVVVEDGFLTHLNHVEHGWVADIGVDKYLQSWRRFASLVGEKSDVFAKDAVVESGMS